MAFESLEEFRDHWLQSERAVLRFLLKLFPFWLIGFLLLCYCEQYLFDPSNQFSTGSIVGLVLIPLVLLWPFPFIRHAARRSATKFELICSNCDRELTRVPNSYRRIVRGGECQNCGSIVLKIDETENAR